MKNNCDCIDIEVGSFDNQVEITHPNLSHPIMVDKCIAEEIKDLLDKGIKTIGSCCGHNTTIPSIIVAPESVKQMEKLGYIHGFNPCIPRGYGSDLMFFPKSVKHEGFELLEWKCIPRPLYTLNPEEVEENKKFLQIARIYLSKCLDEARLRDDIDGFSKIVVSIDNLDYLLHGIKAFQDER